MSRASIYPRRWPGPGEHWRCSPRSRYALVPAAEFERTLVFAAASVAAAVALCSQALGSMFEVSSAAFVPGRGVALRLEGLATSVESRVAGLLSALNRTPVAVLDGPDSAAFWREVGAAAALAPLSRDLATVGGAATGRAHPG